MDRIAQASAAPLDAVAARRVRRNVLPFPLSGSPTSARFQIRPSVNPIYRNHKAEFVIRAGIV